MVIHVHFNRIRFIFLKELLCIIAILSITGCATLATQAILPEEDILYPQARYGEMERILVPKVSDMHTAPVKDLYNLCLAYSGVKKYGPLFECVDHLQQRIDRGDRAITLMGMPVTDVSPWPAILRTQAWIELGELEKAKVEADRACDRLEQMIRYGAALRKWLSREELNTTIYAWNAAGLAYALNGDRAKAGMMIEKLADLSIGSGFSGFDTMRYMAMARIYIALGDYDSALAAIRKDQGKEFARRFERMISGEQLVGDKLNVFAEPPKNYLVGKLLLETGRFDEARSSYDCILQMPQIDQVGEIYWMALYDRGRIAEQDGDIQSAVDHYSRAATVIERQRATIYTEAFKIGFVGDKQAVYRRLVSLLCQQGRHAEALVIVERAKARALVDLLADRKKFRNSPGDTNNSEKLVTQLDRTEVEISHQDETVTGATRATQRAIVLNLKREIQVADAQLASLVSVTTLDADQIRQNLAAGETLLEYYWEEDALYAFVVNQNFVKAIKLNPKGLSAAIEKLRATVVNPQAPEHITVSRDLYARLIAPAVPHLRTPRLTIVPHGALHYLPFAALHSGRGFLIDQFTLRVLPSASVTAFLKKRHDPSGAGLLALGNPNLGNPALALTFAEREAEAIARQINDSTVLTGARATESVFIRNSGRYRYLHLAAHGHFDAQKPLQSGIYLAPDEKNDGLLTVGDLYALNLQADLVTLSACETALGRVKSGDDVIGLMRGFFYAGATAVVASLWRVDDQATSELMTEFYRRLQAEAPDAALARAQQAVRQKYPHPYYWAAFQISGGI